MQLMIEVVLMIFKIGLNKLKCMLLVMLLKYWLEIKVIVKVKKEKLVFKKVGN